MTATRTWQRANTIPEMALVLSLVMLTLFGVFQYALVGFNQIGSDGAAFVGDHAAVAYYGGPTVANGAYAQQVGLANFPHSGANFNPSIPKSGTYEIDIASTHASIGGMSQLFPATTSQTSRVIEPSQSQAAATGPPSGQCATAIESATYQATPVLTIPSTRVPLVGNGVNKIYKKIPVAGIGNALAVDLTLLSTDPTSTTSETGILANVSNNFSLTVGQLKQLSAVLSPINQLGIGVGVTAGISNQLAPLIAEATGGTYVSTGTGGGTITQVTPVSTTTFTAQTNAATSAISAIETSNLGNAALQPVFQLINPILFGSSGLPPIIPANGGLLSPTGSALTALDAAQYQLNALDNAVAPCV